MAESEAQRDDAERLAELLKKSVDSFNALSPEVRAAELHAQRISWVYGNLTLDGSTVTKEQVAKISNEYYGRATAGDSRASIDPLSDERENAFESGKEEGAAAERAEIVAWLRKEAEDHAPRDMGLVICGLAREIERGEHKRPTPGEAE